jgi:hypothetical protein
MTRSSRFTSDVERKHEIEHVVLAWEELERALSRDGDHRQSLFAREARLPKQRAGGVDAASQQVGASHLVGNRP